MDDILAVKGLSGIVGGPHDFAASLGFPGEPDHPERAKRTEDAEARAKAAGKTDGRAITLGIQDLMKILILLINLDIKKGISLYHLLIVFMI